MTMPGLESPRVVGLARLSVPLATFVEELRRWARVCGKPDGQQAILRLAAAGLTVSGGGAQFTVPASGRWPGEARIAGSILYALAKVPPRQDPLRIEVRADRLRIGTLTAPCTWQREGSATIELPLGMEMLDMIRLGLLHDEEALRTAGAWNAVDAARQRAETLLRSAARTLVPLQITEAELRAFASERLGVPFAHVRPRGKDRV